MNKFNKRQGNAVKVKKFKVREIKKRVGAAKKHKETVKVSGGQRTGKAAKKRERLQRLKASALSFNCNLQILHAADFLTMLQDKDSLAAKGLLDAEMQDAPKL